jgi:hypothetical protein
MVARPIIKSCHKCGVRHFATKKFNYGPTKNSHIHYYTLRPSLSVYYITAPSTYVCQIIN